MLSAPGSGGLKIVCNENHVLRASSNSFKAADDLMDATCAFSKTPQRIFMFRRPWQGYKAPFFSPLRHCSTLSVILPKPISKSEREERYEPGPPEDVLDVRVFIAKMGAGCTFQLSKSKRNADGFHVRNDQCSRINTKTKCNVGTPCFRAVWNFPHSGLFDMEICGLGL
jgi:hypothetical protein